MGADSQYRNGNGWKAGRGICPHTGRGGTLFFFFDGGVAHGAVPLVYDPTEGSRYSPDVEAEGLGMIAKTKEELTGGLSRILGNYEDFKQRIEKEQPLWFQATGEETLRNMVGFIKEKMPPVTLKEIYVVDADTLTRERPVGVSGLLRCKNCEDFWRCALIRVSMDWMS